MKTYRVSYERDEAGWWVASVRDVPGCHTQGRTIEQARRRIREALDLFVGDAKTAKLVDDVKLSAEARRALNRLRSARARAAKERDRAQVFAEQAVRVLTKELRLSVRDAGELLELSHQRVQQIAQGRAG